MNPPEPYRMLADLKPGDHLCFLYGSETEHRAVLAAFLGEGLKQGHKVIYLRQQGTPEAILAYLKEAGLEAEPYLASGQLKILKGDSACLSPEKFDPDRLLDFLRGETRKALDEGYAALRVTGEMVGIPAERTGPSRLIEYEDRLGKVITGSPCLALCQYDCRIFPAGVLLPVLAAHPLVIVGTQVIENVYHLSPGQIMSHDTAQDRLDKWLSSLLQPRRAEEELKSYREQLEKLIAARTAELEKANLRLKQEIAERQKIEDALEKGAEKIKLFAYSVIHDLKNPAIGIYGVANLLLKHYGEALDERGRKFLEQIIKASEHIAELVKKIGVYIITKEVPLNLKPIDLKEILQVVREEFEAQLEVRRIRWCQPETFPPVKADGLYILRALRNLVDNALKYGGEQLREVKIGVTETEQVVVLAVTDDGVGIPTEDTEKIFGLFQRPDVSLGVEGAGLGLAIVREIAERHGGRTWVESGPAGGTTFYLSLAK